MIYNPQQMNPMGVNSMSMGQTQPGANQMGGTGLGSLMGMDPSTMNDPSSGGGQGDILKKLLMMLMGGMQNSQAFYNPYQQNPAIGQGMAQTGNNAMQMMMLKKLLNGNGTGPVASSPSGQGAAGSNPWGNSAGNYTGSMGQMPQGYPTQSWNQGAIGSRPSPYPGFGQNLPPRRPGLPPTGKPNNRNIVY